MPSLKHNLPLFDDGGVDVEAWLAMVSDRKNKKVSALVQEAASLARHIGAGVANPYGESCLRQGIEMADILLSLNLDDETIAASLVSSSVQYADLGSEDISEQLGEKVAFLVAGVSRMDAIHESHGRLTQSAHLSSSIDNLRKMLLAMVGDIRVVLIKLAERLTILRHAAPLSENKKRRLAQETIDIYTPLANRLGIAQLKWQLEDYSFRYLDPQKYKEISQSLKQRRVDRDFYVQKMVTEIQDLVEKLEIKQFEVYGRAKHIYSIYRKMYRKKLPVEEIYDVIAIRVLVPTVEDCYAVLGEVQGQWKPIKKEFDDYISNPKPNGYQSIHTAVIGPDDRVFEVQIRTIEMHNVAELGVAAHWMYKEGRTKESSFEAKIAWLRNVMDWQKEISEVDEADSEAFSHIFEDRVYVFTPRGDVIDLPTGATALDFAYHIHSEVGNRCKGVKINDKLVPLTYQLKMGDQVDVITAKNSTPSRDWLNPHRGYLFTSRAKAKVLHWFRQQDYERNLAEGEDIVAREAKRLNLKVIMPEKLIKKMNLHSKEDLYAAVGRGDIGVMTVLNAMQGPEPKSEEPVIKETKNKSPRSSRAEVSILGVDNLLTSIARCCKPVPGDDVVGYLTMGRGVSIHRADCSNIVKNNKIASDRLIEVSWGDAVGENYIVDLKITANERASLMRDITALLSSAKVGIVSLKSAVDKSEGLAYISLSIEVDSLNPLGEIIAKIKAFPGILDVRRQG